jgi:hypothetical protein
MNVASAPELHPTPMDDEVMAWRVVAYHLAGELGLRQDRVDEAVVALREVALEQSTAANVRSHARNRIIAAMHDRRRVSGGRKPAAAGPPVFTFGLEASPRPASLDLAAKSGAQRPDRPNGRRYPRVGRGAAPGSANPRSLS